MVSDSDNTPSSSQKESDQTRIHPATQPSPSNETQLTSNSALSPSTTTNATDTVVNARGTLAHSGLDNRPGTDGRSGSEAELRQSDIETMLTHPVPQAPLTHHSDSMHRVLRGRFELIELIGAGGMGDVFLAKDLLKEEMQDSECWVALKLLNDTCRAHFGALQALQREAKKSQVLSHPNIVTVYDFDRDGEEAFITMEYIEGVSLKDYLKKHGAMSYEQALDVVQGVARGLAFAHKKGYVHADIKPANLFLTKDNEAKVLDFGIAQAFKDSVKEAPNAADELTKNAMTPAYASVEMIEGQDLAPSDDVYALACVMYELLVGNHPFLGRDGFPIPATKAQELQLKISPIPGVSRRHMAALRKGLAFNHKDRFENAGDFIDAIKPRPIKRYVALLSATVLVTGAVFWGADYGIERVVPSVDSISESLPSVARDISEGDTFLDQNEIEAAYRLYSQAWTTRAALDENAETQKALIILTDRMNSVAKVLIEQAEQVSDDEYRLREYAIAMEFLLKDDIVTIKDDLQEALDNIRHTIKE